MAPYPGYTTPMSHGSVYGSPADKQRDQRPVIHQEKPKSSGNKGKKPVIHQEKGEKYKEKDRRYKEDYKEYHR